MTYTLPSIEYERRANKLRKQYKHLKKVDDFKATGYYLDNLFQIQANKFKAHHLSNPNLFNEYCWNKDNRPVIFPQSAELIPELRECQLDIKNGDSINFPFESFMVSVPKHSTIDTGSPCLVTCLTLPRVIELAEEASKAYGSDKIMPLFRTDGPMGDMVRDNEPDDNGVFPTEMKFLTITHCPSDINKLSTFSFWGNEIPGILKSTTHEEVLKCTMEGSNMYNQYRNSSDPGDRAFYQEFLNDTKDACSNIRFVLALSAYLSFTNNKNLIDGLPTALNQQPLFSPGSRPKKIHPISMSGSEISPSKTTSASVVKGHFRQLMHEKYYRNEQYSHMKPGERFVWVDGYTKGNIDASTALNEIGSEIEELVEN